MKDSDGLIVDMPHVRSRVDQFKPWCVLQNQFHNFSRTQVAKPIFAGPYFSSLLKGLPSIVTASYRQLCDFRQYGRLGGW
jgi:hypothetical protein